jgi:hypothetical protein
MEEDAGRKDGAAVSEIAPCPFCGGGDIRVLNPTCLRDSPYNRGDRAYPLARCQGCGAEVPGQNWDYTGMSALRKWQRRPANADPAR